jgi:streptogramin lyase
MKSLSVVFITLVALLGSAFQLYAAESETFTGAAAPTFSTIPVPAGSRPQAILATPDGAIWVGTLTKLFKLTSDGKLSETPLPANLTTSGRATIVQFLTFGPDGNLWAPYNQGNVIWSMTLAGKFTIYPMPTPGTWPRNITSGPDGNLWFTELEGNKIGRITTKGEITEYAIPTPHSGPHSIVTGSDGALWFTEYNKQKLGRITANGEITEFPTPGDGGDGPGGPRCLSRGPDGALWYTEWRANKIGRMTMKGEVTEFDIPTPGSGSIGIYAAPDGNVWFCENKGGKVGCLSPKGIVTEYPQPSGSEPFLITGGQDGTIWFTDEQDRIGSISVPGGAKPQQKD